MEHGFDREYGARPLRRLIQREIENELARKVLSHEYEEGDTITADVEDNHLVFRRSPGTNATRLKETIAA